MSLFMIRLFPDEVILHQSGDGAVILTSHRLSYKSEGWGNSGTQSVLLEQIICCDSYLRKDTTTLILAIGLAIGAFLLLILDTSLLLSLFLALTALLFGLLHLLSRRNVIVVYSPGMQIRIDAGKMEKAQIRELINRIDNARELRQQYIVKRGVGL